MAWRLPRWSAISILTVSVFLSLFRDLPSHFRCGIERVLGPIMFTDWAWRRGLLCSGQRGFGLVLVMSLHEESAAQDGRDEYYDSGSHALNQSTLRARGTLLCGYADGR